MRPLSRFLLFSHANYHSPKDFDSNIEGRNPAHFSRSGSIPQKWDIKGKDPVDLHKSVSQPAHTKTDQHTSSMISDIDNIDDLVEELGAEKEPTSKPDYLQAKKNKYNDLVQYQKLLQEEEAKLKNKGKLKNIEIGDKFVKAKGPRPSGNKTQNPGSPSKEESKEPHTPQELYAANLQRFNSQFPFNTETLHRGRRSIDSGSEPQLKKTRAKSFDKLEINAHIELLETFRGWYSESRQSKKLEELLERLKEERITQEAHAMELILKRTGQSIQPIKVEKFGVWGELWEYKKELIRERSSFGHFPSYKLRQFIVKGGDDLRQELLAMQFIYKFDKIWKEAGLPIKVRPYDIIVSSEDSGFLGIFVAFMWL